MTALNKVSTFILVLSVMLCFNVLRIQGDVDLFISQEETNRTLGLKAVVHYVENGKINTYAEQFMVLVGANLSHLNFFWRSKAKFDIDYVLDISVDKVDMLRTYPSIPERGKIPNELKVFTIYLQCTGRKGGAAVVKIRLSYTYPSADRPSSVVLQRRKICLKSTGSYIGLNQGSAPYGPPGQAGSSKGSTNFANGYLKDGVLVHRNKVQSSSEEEQYKTVTTTPNDSNSDASISARRRIFYIAIGLIFGCVLVVASLLLAYFVQVKKPMNSRFDTRHQYSVAVASPNCTAQTQPFLRTGSPSTMSKYSVMTANQSASVYSGIAASVPIRRASPTSASSSLLLPETRVVDVTASLAAVLVNRDRVDIGELVHEGTFGEIFIGAYKIPAMEENGSEEDSGATVPILVKTVKRMASDSQRRKYLEEGFSFASVAPFPNVSQVIAAFVVPSGNQENEEEPGSHCGRVGGVEVLKTEAVFLCYAHNGFGNMKKFLLRCRGVEEGTSHSLRTQDVVYMGLQIIRGMQHLHRYRILHRDLAARNCLINEDMRVEICDTALSRDLFPQDYHCLGDNENRPIKWLAIEALDRQEFSSASDVWAFGVTMWELLTCGLQPYMDVDADEMHKHLKEGFRLQQPYYCPDELYGVIFCCWGSHPVSRPTFDQLLIALDDFYTQLTEYI